MASGFPGKIPRARLLAIGAALFALYLLLGFFAGPPLVKRILTHGVAEALQRQVSVGEVRVNPLALSVELKDLALAEADGAPIASVRRALVDFQLSSLPRRAWTFSELSIEGLDLRADIAPGGRFNLLALLRDLPKPERKEGDALPRVLLQHVVLSGGAVGFSDRSLREPASAALAPIDLEVSDLSTIPDREGKYSVSVRLPAGGAVAWRGEASLQPLASTGEISAKGMRPATAWRFAGHRFPDLAEPKGEFDVAARYRFSYAQGAARLAVEDLVASGRGAAIAASAGKGAALALAAFELAGGKVELAAVHGKPWQASIAVPKFSAGALDYTDRGRSPPLQATAKAATIGLAATLEERDGGIQVLLRDVAANFTTLAAGEPGAAQPHAVLDAIALEGGTLDLAGRRLELKRVVASGGELNVQRRKDGGLPLARFLAPTDEGLLRREAAGALQAAKKEGRPWRIALEALEVTGTRVALADLSFGEPIAYDVRDLRFALRGYASDGRKPVALDAALRFEQGGTLQAKGELAPGGERIDLEAKLERLSLKPLAPAIGRRTLLALESGELSASAQARYRGGAGARSLRAAGALRVDNLAMSGRITGEKLLGWKSLAASGATLSLAPDALRIEDVKFEGLHAKIVVAKDRSVNLVKMIVTDSAGGAAPAAAARDFESPIPASIERLRIEDSVVDFADLSLVLPFGAKVTQFGGVVQGLSTGKASRAAVKLEGRVDEYGLARAEGSLSPLYPKSFLDLAVTFRNVEMPPLSPYSVTFAGRRIASGRLALDLNYKINEGKLAGDNHVVLEKFTLGEKVESPGAADLPLDLAVALLTDSNGRIDLAVPVSGDLNDPQFSYGPVIWQAIQTAIGKIVSAPFRALASLFGGGGSENLESIAFDAGRAALLPPEREKLKKVADGLAQRPQVRLVAEGQAGPADRAALQRRDVALAVGAQLGRAPAAGGEPDPVNVTDAKTQRALEAVFAERNSAEALDKFAADTAKARGKDVARVNAALALFGTASAESAFYEALLRRLNETARVPDAALAQLAEQRAQAVTAHMTTVLAVPPERAGARTAQAPGEARVKLELELAPK